MSTFPLRIGTPDGLLFEGDVERVVCRSINGDLAILAKHCNFCTALGMGGRVLNSKKVSDHHAIVPTMEFVQRGFDGLFLTGSS